MDQESSEADLLLATRLSDPCMLPQLPRGYSFHSSDDQELSPLSSRPQELYAFSSWHLSPTRTSSEGSDPLDAPTFTSSPTRTASLLTREPPSLYESWLSHDQYFALFNSMGQYPIYDDLGLGAHRVPFQPSFIYTQPSESIYFLKCPRLLGMGSFGFPRVFGLNKGYEWKKMSFFTDIPASAPMIRYITAGCYRKGDKKVRDALVYRLHAVMPLTQTAEGLETCGEYVLVHIRKVLEKRDREEFEESREDGERPPKSAHI